MWRSCQACATAATLASGSITANAWLPAVLESSLLAYLRVGEDGLQAFRPWRVLRRWADASVNEPQIAFGVTTPVDETVSTLLGRGQVDGLTPAAGIDRSDACAACLTVLPGDAERLTTSVR